MGLGRAARMASDPLFDSGWLGAPGKLQFMTMGGAGALRQYQLSHLQTIEAQSIHVMREVAAEFERRCCSSPGARTRS